MVPEIRLMEKRWRRAVAALICLQALSLGSVSPVAAVETLDMLRALQFGGSATSGTPGDFTTALCVANNSTDTRDFLVTASFTQETTGGPGVSVTVDSRLGVTDGVTTTYSTVGQRFLDGGADRGNGMLAWIFENVSGTGDCTTAQGRAFCWSTRTTTPAAPSTRTASPCWRYRSTPRPTTCHSTGHG